MFLKHLGLQISVIIKTHVCNVFKKKISNITINRPFIEKLLSYNDIHFNLCRIRSEIYKKINQNNRDSIVKVKSIVF